MPWWPGASPAPASSTGPEVARNGGGATGLCGAGRGAPEGERHVLREDHDEIRKWAEKRGGTPTVVKGTEGEDGEGILRIDFAEPDDKLEPISWDEFFETFEDRKLAFLHQDKTANGQESRFFKFVKR